MPIIDMPLEQLREYKGTNVKPADFDEFWDRSLKEADALDTKPELFPANEISSPLCDTFHLYFTGTGDARVHAKVLVPKNINGKAPAILHFHGYSGSSSDFDAYLGYAATGFVVAALDCRGQGGLSSQLGEGVCGDTMIGQLALGIEGGKENLLFKHIFLDTYLLSKIIKNLPYVDEKRVGAFGGSQGGGLTVACAALDPEIKCLAPTYPFLSDYKRVWDMDLDVAAYNSIREYFRRYDGMHKREEEIFTLFGYIDVHNLAPRIKGEMLMFTGLLDNICPPSTQFAIYNNCTCKKDVRIFPDYSHEGIPHVGEMTYDFMVKNLLG